MLFRCKLLLGRYHLTNYHLVSFEGDSPILQNKEVRSQTIKKVIVASRLDCLTLIPVTRRPPICSDKAKKIKKITKPAPIRFIKFFFYRNTYFTFKKTISRNFFQECLQNSQNADFTKFFISKNYQILISRFFSIETITNQTTISISRKIPKKSTIVLQNNFTIFLGELTMNNLFSLILPVKTMKK